MLYLVKCSVGSDDETRFKGGDPDMVLITRYAGMLCCLGDQVHCLRSVVDLETSNKNVVSALHGKLVIQTEHTLKNLLVSTLHGKLVIKTEHS